ncbi:MAG: hypothetical protein IID46_09225 [Planctomycetes bacterium]|nr:hypothetical protein [Planctomycetota bacterium]
MIRLIWDYNEKICGASWIEASDDQGRIPEPKQVLEYWERTQQGKRKMGKKQSKLGRKK